MQTSVAKKLFAVGVAASTVLMSLAPFAAKAAAHAAGTNVSSNGTVFMITADGYRRPYTSAGAFLSYGFNSFASVVQANADDLALPQGSFIPPQDGKVICSDRGADKGTCYLITGAMKAGFTSAAVFTGLGFSFSRATSGDVSWMSSTTNIDNTTAPHRPGVLVNDNGTVKLIGTTGYLGIPDLATFNSWGYSFADVVPANAADKALVQTGVMAARIAGQLSPGAVTTTPGTTPGTTPTTGPVSVSLASTNPAPMTLVQGQIGAPLAAFTFSGNGTVTGVTLQRIGVSSNDLLNNVYLYDGANRLTDAASVNSTGQVSFANGSSLFTVNGVRTITVLADIKTGTSNAGQTVGVQLTGVQLSGNVTAAGTPVSGNLMNVSAATSIATVTYGTLTPSGSVSTNPQTGIVVWQTNFSVSQNPVNFTRLALREIGSINMGDISNFKLMVDGTQVSQAQSLDSNSYVTFAISPAKSLSTGSHTVQVTADVTGGASRTFAMSLQNQADAGLIDTAYNVGVGITSSGGTFGTQTAATFTVNSISNSIVLQKSSDSPSGNVSYNGIDVPLGRWTVTSYGEAMKIQQLTVGFTYSSTTGSYAATTLRNGRLLFSGAQYGSTQTVAQTGTQFTPNFIVPANSPVTIEFRADVYSTAGNQYLNADTIQPFLKASTQNAQGQTSMNMTNLPDTNNSLAGIVTVTTGSLNVSKNGTFVNQTTAAPQDNYKIASFYVDGSSVEDININTITLGFGSSTAASSLNNVKVYWNGQAESNVKATVSATGNVWSVSHTLGMNASIPVDVYANLNSAATGTITTTMDISGTTVNSGQTASKSNTAGQTITVGNGSFAYAVDASTPVAALVTASQQGVPTAAFKFTATNDTYKITDLTFTVAGTSVGTQLYVYNGSTLVAQKGVGSGTVSWSGLNIPVVPGTPVVLTTKVDVGAVGTSAGTSGSSLLTTLTGGKYQSSNGTITNITGSNAGNNEYVLKAIPTVTASTLPNSVLAAGVQTLYKYTVTAGSNPIAWYSTTFKVSTSTGVGLDTFGLFDNDTNQQVASCSPTYAAGLVTVVCTSTEIGGQSQVSSSKTYYMQGTVSGSITTGSSIGTSIQKSAGSFGTAATSTAASGSFVWSDMSADNHSTTTADWFGDYLVKNIPTGTLNMTK